MDGRFRPGPAPFDGYLFRLKITERMLGIAMMAGAIEAPGWESSTHKHTAPREKIERAKDSIWPVLLARRVFSMILLSAWCRCSTSFSARARMRSADPGRTRSYWASSLEGGSGPLYETRSAICRTVDLVFTRKLFYRQP